MQASNSHIEREGRDDPEVLFSSESTSNKVAPGSSLFRVNGTATASYIPSRALRERARHDSHDPSKQYWRDRPILRIVAHRIAQQTRRAIDAHNDNVMLVIGVLGVPYASNLEPPGYRTPYKKSIIILLRWFEYRWNEH